MQVSPRTTLDKG